MPNAATKAVSVSSVLCKPDCTLWCVSFSNVGDGGGTVGDQAELCYTDQQRPMESNLLNYTHVSNGN